MRNERTEEIKNEMRKNIYKKGERERHLIPILRLFYSDISDHSVFPVYVSASMGKLIPTMRGNVLSTDKELIPTRYAKDAQVQDCMANDKRLLPILNAFLPSLAHCTLL